MLVLARRVGEKIVIADDIVITIVEIERDKVRIGFEAPLDVQILRNELLPNHLQKKD
jgi:carbon storage regulator